MEKIEQDAGHGATQALRDELQLEFEKQIASWEPSDQLYSELASTLCDLVFLRLDLRFHLIKPRLLDSMQAAD